MGLGFSTTDLEEGEQINCSLGVPRNGIASGSARLDVALTVVIHGAE